MSSVTSDLSSKTLESGISSLKAKLDHFINWTSENGAYIHKSISWEVTEKGISAYYKNPDPRSDHSELVRVPETLTITPEIAVKVLGNTITEGNRNQLTQLLVAKLRFDPKPTKLNDRDLTSFYKPYIDLLPTGKEIGTPLFWDGVERNLIQGTNAHLIIDSKTKHILDKWYEVVSKLDSKIVPQSFKEDLSFYETFKNGKSEHFAAYLNNPSSWTSFPAYLWAHAVFTSRGFPYFIGHDDAKDVQEVFLIPIFDLFNHDNESQIKWDTTIVNGVLNYNFKTKQDLIENVEINNNYGPKSNEDLLLNYGFAIPNNKEDFTTLGLRIPEESLAEASFFDLSLTSTEQSFRLDNKNPLPVTLVNLFSLLVKTKAEKSLTLRNKLEGLRQLAIILDSKIETIKKAKVPSDQKVDSKIIKTAIIYRNAQKKFFQQTFEEITKTEKALLKQYKPLSFKTAFKNDKTFANSLLLTFGIDSFQKLSKSDDIDRALLLWIVRVGNKKHYKEKSVLPDWINQKYQFIISRLAVQEADVKEIRAFYKALFPSLVTKIPEVFGKGDWSIKAFITAKQLISEISFERAANGEIFLIENVKL